MHNMTFYLPGPHLVPSPPPGVYIPVSTSPHNPQEPTKRVHLGGL